MRTVSHALAHVEPPVLNASHHMRLAEGPSPGTIAGPHTDEAASDRLLLPALARVLDIEVASGHEVPITDELLRTSPLASWRVWGIVTWTAGGSTLVHGGGGNA